jgi:hypothetical protein
MPDACTLGEIGERVKSDLLKGTLQYVLLHPTNPELKLTD